MSLFRKAAKRDAVEAIIVEYLRAAGCSWLPISTKDAPDGLLGYMGRHNMLVEIKSGQKAKLRDGQVEWHRRWNGKPVVTLRSLEDAQRLVGKLRIL